jgi:hypothetical protein
MSGCIWENLVGKVVDNRYRLRTLTHSGRNQAEFLAEPVAGESGAEPVAITMVTLPPEKFDEQLLKLHRARQLQHPNLLRIVAGGHMALEGADLLYLAAEPAEQTLGERLEKRRLSAKEAKALAIDVAAALSFLHGQGLVYRSLGLDTTVWADGRWKLADFGGLEPAGGDTAPAEDVRALGTLLREALWRDPLPEPFDALVEECLSDGIAADDVPRIFEERRRAQFAVRWPVAGMIVALILLAAIPMLRRSVQAVARVPGPPPVAAATVFVPPPPAPAEPKPAGEQGIADYASPGMNGRPTASGEPFDSGGLTAASRRYPLGTHLRVTNIRNGKSVVVRVNDRSASHGRMIRLTQRAARDLGFAAAGSARVSVEVVE